MRAADRAAVQAGIPSLVLMENAAYAVLRHLEARYGPLEQKRIAIFCGKGNNGGDGLALARLLDLHHPKALKRVCLCYPPEDLSGDAAAQLQMLEALGIPYSMQLPLDISATTLAIDALLGTGIVGEPREPVADWIDLINRLPLASKVAVDIPSGLGSAKFVVAHSTVTFAAPKPELVFAPTCDAVGELVVAPIGIPRSALAGARLQVTMAADLAPVLHRRAPDSHKGTYGHVAVIGGAAGKSGALQLAGDAALRAGSGFVTLYSPDADFRPALPDLMLGDWERMATGLEGKSVVAIGPGLGADDELREMVDGLFRHWPAPMVFDADALNLLAPLREPQQSGRLRVLTPHPGEMRRLLGRDLGDRLADARELASLASAVVVLKGRRTVIAWPDGEAWINPTGSPALAKAGSGDVLTGMLAAWLSQFPDREKWAVLAAVYCHGRCGELAATHLQERCSLASELSQYLPEVLGELAV